MLKLSKLLVLGSCCLFLLTSAFDDTKATIKQIVEENGFSFEEYTVTSSDGYIGKLHRIPSSTAGAKPVLMMHGQDEGSVSWVFNSPDKAPAFKMANAGYDVWLGNNRGNMYNNEHTTYKNTQPEYWAAAGWEEMGLYDVPAIIDFILGKTGDSQIEAYIGYSRGTSQFFAGASLNPTYYNAKVKYYIALAPVTRMSQGSFFPDLLEWFGIRYT